MIKLQQLKKIFKSKTVLLFLALIILTILLAEETFYNPKVFSRTFDDLKVLATKLYEGNVFKEKSSAKIWTENQSLKFKFQITSNDKAAINQFNQKLGIGNEYLDGISLDLDPETIKELNNFLPVDVTVKITPESINFSNGGTSGIVSSLVGDAKEYSTGSGKLRYRQSLDTEFQLEITDPEPLLKDATASGKFVLSDKLQPLFPILARVGTIEMNVSGKSVNGNISLK